VALALPTVSVDEQPLERALDVFAEHAPEPVHRARSALNTILSENRLTAWSEVAWCASSLSPSGYPVQFIVGPESCIEYLSDVGAPETPASEKLAHALRIFDSLGVDAPPRAWTDAFGVAQRGAQLRTGAWLRGRHGPSADEYTLYIEVPADAGAAAALLARVLPSELVTAVIALGRLESIGVEPNTGRIDLICACSATYAEALEPAMRRFGLEDRAGDLLSLVSRTPARPAALPLGGGLLGRAVSIRGSDAERFMLIAPARRLLGRDRDARRRLLELADEEGWDLSSYADLTRPLEFDPPRTRLHGLIAWSVGGVVAPALRVAIAPPVTVIRQEGALQ
jgi:hypothetical protein